ncbi:MAG: ATP-binding protein [Acidobacteriota bacterium]
MDIAVVSGKGGTGKTYFSTSLALTLENAGYIDLDVEEPNGYIFLKPDIKENIDFTVPIPEINEEQCTFCRKCDESCTYNAISIIPQIKKAIFFPELCHNCGVCTFVCPVEGAIREVDKKSGTIQKGVFRNGYFIEGRLNIGEPSGVPLISGIISKHLVPDRINIIDSPPGTSCPVVESIKKSDFVIIVTEPTPFGLSDMKLILEVAKDMNKRVGVVINKDRGNDQLVKDYLKRENIPILLKIPYSVEIQKAYSKGIPLIETVPELKPKFHNVFMDIKNGKV